MLGQTRTRQARDTTCKYFSRGQDAPTRLNNPGIRCDELTAQWRESKKKEKKERRMKIQPSEESPEIKEKKSSYIKES